MDYSKARAIAQQRIKESIKDDKRYKADVARLYNRTQKDIEREINAQIERFARKEQLSMAEARKQISKTDVQAFSSTAKQYVKEKDFSDLANQQLRAYNVTMRTNRLELLQARINLIAVGSANEEDKMLKDNLFKIASKEYEAQAGILGLGVPSQSLIQRMVDSIITMEYEGATFSERIWENQTQLVEEVNRAVRRTIIQGKHPRTASTDLMKLIDKNVFPNARYAADRIAITETARAQTLVQERAIKDAGIDKKIWIAEPGACDICSGLDGKVMKLDDHNYTIPQHPFCRCSFAAYVD